MKRAILGAGLIGIGVALLAAAIFAAFAWRPPAELAPAPVPSASSWSSEDIDRLFREATETARETGYQQCRHEQLERERAELELSIARLEGALGIGPPVTPSTLGAGGAP